MDRKEQAKILPIKDIKRIINLWIKRVDLPLRHFKFGKPESRQMLNLNRQNGGAVSKRPKSLLKSVPKSRPLKRFRPNDTSSEVNDPSWTPSNDDLDQLIEDAHDGVETEESVFTANEDAESTLTFMTEDESEEDDEERPLIIDLSTTSDQRQAETHVPDNAHINKPEEKREGKKFQPFFCSESVSRLPVNFQKVERCCWVRDYFELVEVRVSGCHPSDATVVPYLSHAITRLQCTFCKEEGLEDGIYEWHSTDAMANHLRIHHQILPPGQISELEALENLNRFRVILNDFNSWRCGRIWNHALYDEVLKLEEELKHRTN